MDELRRAFKNFPAAADPRTNQKAVSDDDQNKKNWTGSIELKSLRSLQQGRKPNKVEWGGGGRVEWEKINKNEMSDGYPGTNCPLWDGWPGEVITGHPRQPDQCPIAREDK
ncbi:hypothetical protein Btru_046337 [Bulinus truncatus]|nr:hypothetical protein Btru_046337 [Bulinus truncatus]